MLGLLLLGMAAFWGLLWGVEILLQRADERAIWKALGESTMHSKCARTISEMQKLQ